jgi:hypothetical protein
MFGTCVGRSGQAVTELFQPEAGWASLTSTASPPSAAITSAGTREGTTATMATSAATNTTRGA